MHDLSVLKQIDIVQPGDGDRFDLNGVWNRHGSDLKLTKELFFFPFVTGDDTGTTHRYQYWYA